MEPFTLIVGILLLLVSGVLVAGHLRSRPTVAASLQGAAEDAPAGPETELKTSEANFRRRQFRRRMQSSLMVGVVGLVLLSSDFVSGPLWRLVHLLGLLLLVVWLVLLALADALATRHYFGRLEQARFLDELRFHVEVRKTEADHGTSSERDGR